MSSLVRSVNNTNVRSGVFVLRGRHRRHCFKHPTTIEHNEERGRTKGVSQEPGEQSDVVVVVSCVLVVGRRVQGQEIAQVH